MFSPAPFGLGFGNRFHTTLFIAQTNGFSGYIHVHIMYMYLSPPLYVHATPDIFCRNSSSRIKA